MLPSASRPDDRRCGGGPSRNGCIVRPGLSAAPPLQQLDRHPATLPGDIVFGRAVPTERPVKETARHGRGPVTRSCGRPRGGPQRTPKNQEPESLMGVRALPMSRDITRERMTGIEPRPAVLQNIQSSGPYGSPSRSSRRLHRISSSGVARSSSTLRRLVRVLTPNSTARPPTFCTVRDTDSLAWAKLRSDHLRPTISPRRIPVCAARCSAGNTRRSRATHRKTLSSSAVHERAAPLAGGRGRWRAW
jgi:hypothetical protein